MRLKVLIGVAVLAALGIGVYAIFGLPGNQSGEGTLQAGAEVDCEFSMRRGNELDPIAVGDLAAFRALAKPLDARSLSFVDVEGKPKTLGDWKGKVVLFNLWATWCPPCREEMPYFETLQTERGGDNFDVVPVSIDLGGDTKPRAFYSQIGLEALPFFQDGSMEVFQQLRKEGVALGMPTTLLIDRNGCALGVLNGPAHWASDDAYRLIDAALALEPAA